MKNAGGNLMFWSFSANGTGNVVKFSSVMKQDKYIKILHENLKQSTESLNFDPTMTF